VLGLEPVPGRERLHEFVCHREQIASAVRDDVLQRLARRGARPERVLVRVDHHHVRARRRLGRHALGEGELSFVHERQREAGGAGGGEPQERAAGKTL